MQVPAEFIHNFGVRSAKVTRGPVARQIMALGRVSRMPRPKVTEVSPGLKGKIISITHKQIGDTVKKGDLLYSMDSAAWRELQQNYIDAVSEEDQQHSKQLQQKLQVLGLHGQRLKQLTKTRQVEQILEITAPVSGSIVDWFAIKGEEVNANSKVVTLGGMNRIPVVISLFEGQGVWINRGQPIVVTVPTLPGVI